MRTALLSLMTFLCLSGTAFSQQVAKSLTSSTGLFVGFYEFKPYDYNDNPNKKYPLIIFLHGVGERGNGTTELSKVLANGIPRNIAYGGSKMTFTVNGVTESFLVLSPQLSTNYTGWINGYTDAMLEYAKKELRVDTDRIYLTGLSAGGGGTWDYVTSVAGNASKFAAIAPVCGSSYTAAGVCNIDQAHLPVWAFHAMDDNVIGVGLTQTIIKLINGCYPAPDPAPLVTYYPSGGHGIWYRSYDESHTYHDPNVYEWFLTKSRKKNQQNQKPVANAGQDINMTLPVNSATLDGSASSSPDGSMAMYSWTKVSGPENVTIASPLAKTTAIKDMVAGKYIFQLKVTNYAGNTDYDSVVVTVNSGSSTSNKAPVANAGNDFTSTNDYVYLSGAASYDPDGSIIAYYWKQVSGPAATILEGTATTMFPVIRDLTNGDYKFSLQVTDNLGKTAMDTVAFTIGTTSSRPPVDTTSTPVIDASANSPVILPGNITLDASKSYSINSTISSYKWMQVSGPGTATIATPASAVTVVNNLLQGTYIFKITISDAKGHASSSDVTAIVVSSHGTNKSPVADAGNDFTSSQNYVYLSAGASYDPDGTIQSYNWQQTSGPATATVQFGNTMFPIVSNLVPGTYVFKLTITDNDGATASNVVSVTISNNKAPVALATNNLHADISQEYVLLDGSSSYDPDGSISSYRWQQIAGPNSAQILSPATARTYISKLTEGNYQFKLTVTDNLNSSDDVVVTLSVTKEANKPPIANAGYDFTTYANFAYLSAGGAYDPDGTISKYSWQQVSGPNTATVQFGNTMFPIVSNLVAGAYTFQLTVTDNSGLSSTGRVVVTVKNLLAISANTTSTTTNTASIDSVSATKFSVYPNPAQSILTINYTSSYNGNLKAIVTDIQGKTMATFQYSKDAYVLFKQIDISHLPAGVYYLQLITDGRKIPPTVQKFIKL